MTLEHQRKSLHYFHSYATFDRIDFSGLSTTEAIGDMNDLVPSVYFPDAADCTELRNNYAILMARVLVEEVDYFKQTFGKYVVKHISHQYSSQMRKKSLIVSFMVYV